MEKTFKFLFFLAVIVAIITVIGLFLVTVKIILLFQPQVNLMGIMLS